jgi:Fur family ferric uptake transcriptional regulator
MTRQRKVILEELQRTDTHPTAEEVYERVRQRLPRVSLATVYRNLEVLSESGTVLKLEMGGRRRYDGNTARRHYHVKCVRCGSVGDVPSSAVTKLDYREADIDGFRVLGHELVFTGLCARCLGEER